MASLSQEELDAATNELMADQRAIEQHAGAKRIDGMIRTKPADRQREVYEWLFGAPDPADTDAGDGKASDTDEPVS